MSHNPPPETQKGSARERLDQNRFQADLKSQLMSKTITANPAAKVHRRNFSNDFHLAGLTGSILASKLAPQAERGLEHQQPTEEVELAAQHHQESAHQPKVHKLPGSKAEHRRTQSNTSEQLAWYQRGPGGIDAMMNAIESQGEFTKLGPSFGYLEHGGGQKLSLIGSGSIPTNNSLKQMIDVHGSSKMIKSKGANFKRQKKPTDNSEGNYSSGNSLLPSNSQIMTGHSLINKSNQLLTTSGIGGEKPSKGPTSQSTGHGSKTGGSNHAPTSGGSITTASSSGDMNCLTSVMCREPSKVAKEGPKWEPLGGSNDHPNYSTSNLLQDKGPSLSKTASHKGELILQHGEKDGSKHEEPAQKGISIQHFLGAMHLACASTTSHNAQQTSNIQYLKAINAMKKPRATVGGVTGNKVPTIIDTRSPQSGLSGTAAKAKAFGFSGLSTKGTGTSSKSTLGVQKLTMNNTSNIGAIASAMVSAAKSKGMSSTGIHGKKLPAGMVTPSLIQSKHYRNPSSILPSSIPTLFNSPLDALLKGGVTMNHRRVQSGDKMNLRGLLQKGQGKSVSKSGSKTKHPSSGLANQAEILKKSFKTELKASNFLLTENMIRSQTKTYKSPNPSSIFAKGYLKKGTDSSETDRFKQTDSQQPPLNVNQDVIKREGNLADPTTHKANPSLTATKPPISTKHEGKSGVTSSAPKKIHHRKIASLPVSNINSKFFQELNLPIAYPLKGNTMTPDESRRNTPTRGRSPRTNLESTSGFHPGPKNFEFEEHEFLPQPPKSALPKLPDASEFYGEEHHDLNSHRNYTSFVIEEDLDELPDNIEDAHNHVSVSPLAKPQVPVQNIRIPERGESGQGSGISTPQIMSRGKYSHNGAAPGQHSDKLIQIESRDSKTKPNPSNVQIALPAYKSSNSPSVSSAGVGAMYSGRQIPPNPEQHSGSRGGPHPYSNTRTNSAVNIPELGSASQLEDKEIVLDFCNLSHEEDEQTQKKRKGGKLHTTEESMRGNHNIQLISPASNVYPGAMAGSASRSPSPRDFKLAGPSAPNTGRKQVGSQLAGKLTDHNVQLLLPTPGSERAESDYQGSDDKSRRQQHQAVRQFGMGQPHTPGKLSNQSPKLAFPPKHHPAKSTAPFNSREFRRQGSEGNVVIDEIRRRDSRPGLINQEVASPAQENRIYSEQNSYRDNFEEPEAMVADQQLDGPPRIPPPRPNAPKQSRFHKFEEVFSDKNEVPLVLQKLLLVDKIKSFYGREKARDIQTTLDFYKIIKLIGKGNFGKVYRAVSVLTGKEVAIKKFEKADIQNDQAKQRIFQEAGNLKKLSHHNIAKLYEVFENKASIFYVMEYATEGDLLNLIESRGPLDEDSARFIAIQVVHGLKHCHSKGVLHRDIKLDNILLSDNFVVKICDFGISKLVKKGEVMTEDSGTAVYIAPEVISGKGYTGFQSDIWSLGVTLYIVLTGRIPFKPPANQSSEVLHQMIKKGEFTFPESIPLSPDVQDLIKQMLCVNPEKRITIDQIMKHPWFNRKIIDRFTTFLKDQSDEASSDHALRKLQELGFPEPSIKKAVNEQYLNHIYCCYQIYKHL